MTGKDNFQCLLVVLFSKLLVSVDALLLLDTLTDCDVSLELSVFLTEVDSALLFKPLEVHVTILSVFVVCVTLAILLPGNNKP